MSETTTLACPECDSCKLRMRKRVADERGASRETPESWVCQECDAAFDEPVEREPKSLGGGTNFGLAKTLLDADPDAVGGSP